MTNSFGDLYGIFDSSTGFEKEIISVSISVQFMSHGSMSEER